MAPASATTKLVFAGTAAAATAYLTWSTLFKRKPDPSPFAYGPVRILASDCLPGSCNSSQRRITLALPTSTAHRVATALVPYHLDVKNSDLVVARSYTPVHVRDNTIQLLVKRYSVGETGKWMHRQQLGSEIEVCGPLNEWVLPAPRDKDGSTLAMIAGGTGVTPFIQILDAALNTPTAPTATNATKWSKFHLVYFARTPEELLDKPWLDAMAAKFPDRLAVRYVTGGRHQLTPELLKQALPPPGRGLTVVCGPDGFVRSIAGTRGRDLISQGPLGGMLAAMGYSEADVYKMQ